MPKSTERAIRYIYRRFGRNDPNHGKAIKNSWGNTHHILDET